MEDRFKALSNKATKSLADVREQLGDEGADKTNAIIAILQIGGDRSVSYSKAILAAAEMALERMSCFAEKENR